MGVFPIDTVLRKRLETLGDSDGLIRPAQVQEVGRNEKGLRGVGTEIKGRGNTGKQVKMKEQTQWAGKIKWAVE